MLRFHCCDLATDTIDNMQDIKKREFTILLVDDREQNLLSLEEILREEGRVFLHASSGNEALKIALNNERIGLIMLDVQMPEMDGFEVAELLKSNSKTRNISIIFVTAINNDERNMLRGYRHGAVDFLYKPLDVNVTRAKVNVFEQLYFHQLELRITIDQKNKINKQLERFMYIVAHDLKSPLAGIAGLLDIIKQDPRIGEIEELRSYLDLMSDASEHLKEMIGSILEYSRKTDRDQVRETVNVYEMVTLLAQLLFPPRHITISIQRSLPVIVTHKFKLQQVFQNLISNAIKYNDKPQGQITIDHTDDGEFIRFYVKDNGPGIKEDDQQKVFKLFETGDNRTYREDSTGVGLNITKMLVEEQGGKIGVESVLGQGSTFFFQWSK